MKKQFSLVFFAWLGVCLLGALPFYFSGFFPNFTDAVFETVSGFTTTGATVLRDIEALPRQLLLWRSMTQWLGGMGVLLTFSLVPLFTEGGFQVRKTENTFLFTLLFYIGLTALQFVLLVVFRMNWFDALTNSFSTVSTGGFSIRNNSVAYYNSPAVEWIFTLFMFLAGVNFFLAWLIFHGKAANVMRNSEARAYTLIVFVAAAVVAAAIFPKSPSFEAALRQAFFHVVSLISTTGFYSADYGLWPYAAQTVLFFLLFCGGCSGSVAGGVKVIRYVMLSKQTWNEMRRHIYPHAVFGIRLDGKSENKRKVHGAAGFVFLYFLIVFLAAMLVSSSGAGVFASFIAALVCQGNTGVSLAFTDFPAYVKWGLCLVMIMGRLELWIVLVLFTKNFWRR